MATRGGTMVASQTWEDTISLVSAEKYSDQLWIKNWLFFLCLGTLGQGSVSAAFQIPFSFRKIV